MTVVTARNVARGMEPQVAAEVARGGDPGQSLADFAPRFLADCAHQWKPNTLAGHRRGLARQVLPVLGKISLAALSREDVLRWRAGEKASPGTVNRAMAVLSSMMRHAEVLGLRPAGQNPCQGLRRRKSGFAADYLDATGYATLGRALAKASPRLPLAVAFVRFVALTGCRKSEATGAAWHQLDGHQLDGQRLALPDGKSGPKAIWLGAAAAQVLAALPREGAMIFGDDPLPLARQLRALWPELRKALRRPGFRLHDLRHSHASVAVNAGYSLQVIGGRLGHSDCDSTAGYAHLDLSRVAEASQRVGRHLGRAMKAAKPDLPKRKAALAKGRAKA
jgi:integrase